MNLQTTRGHTYTSTSESGGPHRLVNIIRKKNGAKNALLILAQSAMPRQQQVKANANAALLDENRLLGTIIDDLKQQRQPGAPVVPPATTADLLRATEDALLDAHAENKVLRNALESEREAVRRMRGMLEGADHRLRACAFQQRQHLATEQVLVSEVALIEREQWLGDTDRAYVMRLRQAADDAVHGMEDAQAECRWLHGQLQKVLREARGPGGSALGSSLRAELSDARPVTSSGSTDGNDDHVDAMRAPYVRAVQRCHELQLHVARVAEEGDRLRPLLLGATERVGKGAEYRSTAASSRALRSSSPFHSPLTPSSAPLSPPLLSLLRSSLSSAPLSPPLLSRLRSSLSFVELTLTRHAPCPRSLLVG